MGIGVLGLELPLHPARPTVTRLRDQHVRVPEVPCQARAVERFGVRRLPDQPCAKRDVKRRLPGSRLDLQLEMGWRRLVGR